MLVISTATFLSISVDIEWENGEFAVLLILSSAVAVPDVLHADG